MPCTECSKSNNYWCFFKDSCNLNWCFFKIRKTIRFTLRKYGRRCRVKLIRIIYVMNMFNRQNNVKNKKDQEPSWRSLVLWEPRFSEFSRMTLRTFQTTTNFKNIVVHLLMGISPVQKLHRLLDRDESKTMTNLRRSTFTPSMIHEREIKNQLFNNDARCRQGGNDKSMRRVFLFGAAPERR